METVKVSSKGQIVIPKELRDAFHIAAGAELEIYRAGEEIHLKLATQPVQPTTVSAGRGLLAARGSTKLTDDELRSRIADKLKARDAATKRRG